MKLNFNELILSSGGSRGVTFIGALIKLDSLYPLKNFKYYTGSSIGALLLTLINIGYKLDELKDLLLNLEFENFQEFKLRNLLKDCGFDSGIKLDNLFQAIFEHKDISKNITFLELYNKTHKILTINTVNISTGEVEYNNFINTPNLELIKAIRMSSNIPIIFSPIEYNNCFYVDGALLDPYPLEYNKNTNKLGLYIVDNDEYKFFLNKNVEFIKEKENVLNYCINIMRVLYSNYLKKNYNFKKKNTIYIKLDIENLTFEMNKDKKNQIMNKGKKIVNNFFKKIYEKKRKIFLSKKYYYIWKKKVLFN